MKLIFTKLFFITCFLTLGMSLIGQDQINTLVISSPASIAGEYEVTSAQFGSNEVVDPVFGGDLLLIEDTEDPTSDGCTGAVNDLTGFIAVIDRGGCAFVDKAANAVAAGAIALVVCNNVDGDVSFDMGGDSDVMIPCVMATQNDCATIRAEFGSTVSVAFDYTPPPPCDPSCNTFAYPETTVWGAGGEGDFACDLGDWVAVGLTSEANTWKWDSDGVHDSGWGTLVDMSDPWACNGSAIMDYAGYNTTGATGEYWTSELISPVIDMTEVDNPILHFSSANLPLNSPFLATLGARSSAFWSYSLDGGMTWQDTTLLESQNFWNSERTEILDGVKEERFIMQEAANNANVRVKFIGAGDFYHWTVDGVYFTNEFLPEVEAYEGWFSGAPNFKTPASQVDEVAFMIDINNVGNVDFDESSFEATVSKDGAILYTASSGALGAVAAQSNLENTVIPETWPMSAELGMYSVEYTVTATGTEEDINTDNNVVSNNFMVTENVFSKLRTEAEAAQTYMVGLGQDAVYVTYANGYYVPNGAGFRPASLNTGFETNIYSDFGFTTLTGEVRQWVADTNNDGLANLETETTLIAQGQILLDPDNQIDLRNIEIPLDNFGSETGFVSEGQYLAMIHVAPLTPPAEETFMAPLTSGFVSGNDGNKDYYFAPSDFAFEQLGVTLGRPSSLSDFEGAAGTPTDQGARNLDPVDGNDLSWNIAMTIGPVLSNTVDIDNSISMEVYPNPATNFFSVELSLDRVSSDVNVQLVDLSGKVVSNNSFTNVKDNTLKIATDQFSAGVYIVNVFTDSGVKTERILIQK